MKYSYLTVTDQFCGAGGSSIGAEAAGAEVKLAMNHWRLAVETHNSNFPNTAHDCTDISASDPRRYPSTDILITSPECTNHSISKGVARRSAQLSLFGEGKIDPAAERSRATMWDVVRFAEHHTYNIIVVENVVEARKWLLWDSWLDAMHRLGYLHECVYFNSMHAHPTPQSRDRMYVVFWKKGNRAPDLKITPLAYCPKCGCDVDSVQSWKNPTKKWGKYKQQYVYCCPTCANVVEPYYYCAANVIDWSLPAPRIGDRQRPLKEKTLKRIRVGLEKYGQQPYCIDHVHTPRNGREQDMSFPMIGPHRTQLGQTSHSLVVPPFLVDLAYTHGHDHRTTPVESPCATQTSQQTGALVVPPFLMQLTHSDDRLRDLERPMPTAMPHTTPSLVIPPFLSSFYGRIQLSGMDQAVPTVVSIDKHALVIPPPFILSYYTRLSGQQAAVAGIDEAVPTVPGWAVHYLAQPGETPAVEDCGFRMLQPQEIKAAMAFPRDYRVLGNQREQVKQCGNAVTPPVMTLLIKRCVATLGGVV